MSRKRLLILLSIGLILSGIATAYLGLEREILLVVDGEPQTVRTRALTLNGVVRDAGFSLSPDDQISPEGATFMIGRSTAQIERARTVYIHQLPADEVVTIQSAERIPANLMAEAGLELYPGDVLTRNGLAIDPYSPLPDGADTLTLEYHSAIPLTIQDGQTEQIIYSAEQNVYAALAEHDINLNLADRISPPGTTRLDQPLRVEIERAQPVSIVLADRTIETASTAGTVSQLLTEEGISLQGLDYTIPAEDQPLPGSRKVQLVRVQDEMVLEQKPIPFSSSYQQDSETELDQKRVITPGEFGVEVSRVRIRLEDGVETERISEAAWVAKEPQDQVIGYGTQPVVKTIDTPYGTLEYWRAVNVFATSYSPCRLGVPNYCNTQTASGAQLQQGMVAVTRAWYSWMRGQQVYIPGYGVAVIADVGGGIPGRYWVDLGYSDDDFKSWASNVTMYFLTPIPGSYPTILP